MRKILIVDDDEIMLAMLRRMLVSEGYEVLMAQDGQEALRIIREADIRFVLSDWEMPEMDGVELCQQIRSMQTAGYIYTILLTSRSNQEDIVEGLSAGADDFISKPYDPAELRVRLKVGLRILSLETRHVAIFALAKLAESRDPETGLHLERMREYSRIIARYIHSHKSWQGKLSADFVDTIYLTSPLHDIGKVGIPDCVLLKPGRLTDEEFTIMKFHTEIGGQTLAASVQQYPTIDYLRIGRDIALCHHERYNGSGYPHKLAGEGIPLGARIVALADVYDALTSKRVYKEAFTHTIARNMIVNESGTHFDPLAVEAFLATEDQFEAVRAQYPINDGE